MEFYSPPHKDTGKLSVPSISKEFLDPGNFDTTTSATTVTGTNTVHINYGRYI